MAVTGAVIVFSVLPADKAGPSLSLPSRVRMNTKRAGELLAEVGPYFSTSYSSCSVSSETGLSCHLLWVRASLNNRARPAASMVIGKLLLAAWDETKRCEGSTGFD